MAKEKDPTVAVTEIDAGRRPGMHMATFKRKQPATMAKAPPAPAPETGEAVGFERTAIGTTNTPGLHQPQFTHKGPKAKRVITNFRG